MMDRYASAETIKSMDQEYLDQIHQLLEQYEFKRRTRATGGSVPHVGPIHSPVAGRTDHLALDVPSGSYVIPADIVSGLGQGNTASGMEVLRRMFPHSEEVKGKTTPIMAAGGEFVISPQDVTLKGKGDINHGHAILDSWVKLERKKLQKTLAKLPGPSK